MVYGRKVNAIHRWFVENVQGGEDDCGEYEVSREQLQELLDTVNEVLEKVELAPGLVLNGYTYQNGERLEMRVPGQVVLNPEVCENLLPTQSGFFFGSTEYDEYYVRDLEYTKEVLEKAIADLDAEHPDEIVAYAYTSSW
ncbi:hypothetical protein D6833_00315 [Candidatus Parcubacteria bacterium]|nr:MAG: hypothetical protein D6833_00315 [Candidatus Parcubacteria bacterium]